VFDGYSLSIVPRDARITPAIKPFEFLVSRRSFMTSVAEDAVSKAFLEKAQSLFEEYLGKIETCVGKLTDEQVWWRSNPESNSIGNLLLHLSGNARQWIICGLGNERDERQRQTEFDARDAMPREQLLRTIRSTVSEVATVLSGFDPARLLDQHHIQNYDTTALDAIFHVTEHFSMHTGQIILITKQLTAQDLRFYNL
jgi:uncharacterized damage-inducible protein DinB